MAKKNTAANVIIAIIVIIFLVVVIGLISIDGILRSAIQSAMKKQLNTDISISKVSLKIASGTIEISNLKIANPKGYQYKDILELKSLLVKTSLGSLLSNPVEINQITMDDIAMVIEQKGLSSNLKDLLKGMPPSTAQEKPAEKQKNVHISSVDINNISVTAKLLPIPGKSDAVVLKVESLHLSDVGGNNKSLAQVVGIIFAKISSAVAARGQGIIPSELLGPIQGAVNEKLGVIQSEGTKVLEEAGKKAKDIEGQLKGIFKRK